MTTPEQVDESQELHAVDGNQWYEKSWSVPALLAATFTVWAFGGLPWCLSALELWSPSEAISAAGVFGDSFGAVNALLSAAALAFVVRALYRQQKELAITRAEYVLTRDEHKKMVEQQASMAKSQEIATAVEVIHIRTTAIQTLVQTNLELSKTGSRSEDPAFLRFHERRDEAEALTAELTQLASIAEVASHSPRDAMKQLRWLYLIELEDRFRRLANTCETCRKQGDLNGNDRLFRQLGTLVRNARRLGVDISDEIPWRNDSEDGSATTLKSIGDRASFAMEECHSLDWNERNPV